MQHALRSHKLIHGDRYVSSLDAPSQADDDLGFAVALKVAVPAGIGLWAMGIYALIRFFS
jgi:hypothetical protein